MEQSVFEAAGRMDGLRRLAAAWHARVMSDEVVSHAFAWATTTSMARYHHSADDVPNGLRIRHWSWDGLVD